MPMSVGVVVFLLLVFPVWVREMCVWMSGRELQGGRA